MHAPHLLEFSKLGAPEIGFISVVEQRKVVPFEIQRVFWTYSTPESVARGRHAHHVTEQVLIAAAGLITVTTELVDGTVQIFRLDDPHVGLYVPPCAWHTILYAPASVQLVLASTRYDEDDYIRDYASFKKIWTGR